MPRKRTDEARVIELISKGKALHEIIGIMGVCEVTIRKIAKENFLALNDARGKSRFDEYKVLMVKEMIKSNTYKINSESIADILLPAFKSLMRD